MRATLGRFVLGLVAGLFLSRMRAQAGGDVLAWPVAEPEFAALERALALGVLGLWSFRSRFGLEGAVLCGLPVGFALHGFFYGPPASPSFLAFVFLLLAALAGRTLAGGRAQDQDDAGAQRANLGEMLGLFVAGAGVAVALESVARHVRLFGAGLAQDDSVFGAVFLALVSFGALAFGWLAGRALLRRLSFPVLLAASAAACFAALALVDSMSTVRDLDLAVRRFWMDGSYHGTLGYDALVAARVFVLPALVLGAALGGARGERSLASALFGAAVGVALVPRLLAPGAASSTQDVALFSAQFVPLASLVALAGAALAILSESKRAPRHRYVALALVLPCGLPALLSTVKPIYVLSPWLLRPTMPFLALDSPAGFVTVEPSTNQFKFATLDRRRISPTLAENAADLTRIRLALGLVPPAARARRALRVLLVGQLTVLRARELEAAGATTIDRSAAWHATMPNLENELFAAQPGQPGYPLPAGNVLAPAEARDRLTRGDYDLVIAPPIDGDTPILRDVEAPAGTVIVRWFATDEPLRASVIPESTFVEDGALVARRVLLPAGPGLDDLSFALVTHGWLAPVDSPERPLLLAIEPRSNAERPLDRLTTRAHLREHAARAALATRLAAAAHGERERALTTGLRDYHAAQIPSSPFENAAQKVELDDAVLESFERAAAARILDPFTRGTWEWLAWVLTGKRDVERIDRFVAPLAASHAPWPALEVALARADVEGLEPRRAIDRLAPFARAESAGYDLLVCLGDAQQAAGEPEAAITTWRRASALSPLDRALSRKLALALLARGDPEGRARANQLLLEDPDDEELKAALASAPSPR